MTTPSRKDRMRPAELLILSGVFCLFVGLVVFMSTRNLELAAIFLGVTFVLTLVVLAMLALSVAPDGEERKDIDDQDRPAGH
jgi:succinate-acetate transporter protein